MEHEYLDIITKLYKKTQIKKFQIQNDNQDYYACEFMIGNKNICFRKGKLTPAKLGHFVSLWKRVDNNNKSYDTNDKYDVYIFYVEDKEHKGYFSFTKDILLQHKILSDKKNNIDGKLGFRLYASWYDAMNNTAKISQKWQIQNFIKI
ncbi:MepB-like protein [Bodo saltans virus]|uniref:MepB-like protein n=1 Tax=Bodo saltans virus TaxID=2024608 RepID=A0A2H4UW84_9VIRU|nr:MepB-like protein [Bodo saltans virus]ATZ81095.1 MepB-like protein [Bodo saltans virus]